MVSVAMQRISFRAWGAFLLALLYMNPAIVFAQAESSINISVETPEIYAGDLVVLEIESIGLLDPLDIQPLLSKATFLRETTGTRIAVVKGKVVEIALRRMEFVANKEDTLIFGPLQADAVGGLISSNSVSVKVLPALDNIWSPEPGDSELTVKTSMLDPLFGEQVLLVIELKHQHAIADETISLPPLDQFDVVPIHEERRTIDNDTDVRKLSWRYLIHPRASGEIILGSVHWSGTMVRSRTQRGKFERTSDPIKFNVKPVQVENDDWWLPSTAVTISEQWSLDVKTLSAGDEVLRTITVVADGVIASQLPIVKPLQSRAIQTDLIKTHAEHKLINERTQATGVYTFRVTAMSPIPVFLDTVRVPWWNVNTDEMKQAILPARRINVGLPERDDMLAKLSLQGSIKDRLWYRLQSFDAWQTIVVALAGFISLVLAFMLALPAIKNCLRTLRLRLYGRRLKSMLAKQRWQDMYHSVSNAKSDTVNPVVKFSIMKKLNQTLFGQDSVVEGTANFVTVEDIDSLMRGNGEVDSGSSVALATL